MSDDELQQALWAQGWGIAPEKRRNRPIVRLLLLLTPPRQRIPHPVVQHVLTFFHRVVSLVVSSDFRAKQFGGGLFLPHPYGIVVHAATVLGEDVTIFQNVTIGENHRDPGVAKVGDRVLIGAGAIILGPVTIGDDAVVAAGSVLIDDVPPGAVAVGNPARIISR